MMLVVHLLQTRGCNYYYNEGISGPEAVHLVETYDCNKIHNEEL